MERLGHSSAETVVIGEDQMVRPDATCAYVGTACGEAATSGPPCGGTSATEPLDAACGPTCVGTKGGKGPLDAIEDCPTCVGTGSRMTGGSKSIK